MYVNQSAGLSAYEAKSQLPNAVALQMMYYADYFTESILGIWEETLKSVVREGFTNTTR